jgi:hypothetical protein
MTRVQISDRWVLKTTDGTWIKPVGWLDRIVNTVPFIHSNDPVILNTKQAKRLKARMIKWAAIDLEESNRRFQVLPIYTDTN